MKISDLELYLVEMPRRESGDSVRSVLVRLASVSGVEGWGESAVDWQAAELPGRRDALLTMLGGRSIFDIQELHALEALRSAPLRCGLEMAFWDLVGRTLNEPLCRLFGGEYRRQIPLAVPLADTSPRQAAQVARELADQGFYTQMLTSCGRPGEDVEMVSAVREAAGDRVELRFDGAARYDMETARDLCAELEEKGLQFFLDPLRAGDLHEIASLGRQTSVPLAVWRPIAGPADVLAAVRWRAAPFVVVDLQRVGGMLPARDCAAVAEAGRTQVLLSGGPSLGIATAAVLQLAASTPVFLGCSDCAYPQLRDDILAEPLEVVDGMMVLAQDPGLGVAVDRAKVEEYQVT